MTTRQDGDYYHEMSEPQTFQDRQRGDRERQDAVLDQIHSGAQRLKAGAHAINDEVVDQTVMIGDLSDNMNDAHGDLEQQAEAARVVNAHKKHACKLYGVIALLVVVVIVLYVV